MALTANKSKGEFNTCDIFKMMRLNASTNSLGMGFRDLEPIIEKASDFQAYMANNIDGALRILEASRNVGSEVKVFTKNTVEHARQELSLFIDKVQALVDEYVDYKNKLDSDRNALKPSDIKSFAKKVSDTKYMQYEKSNQLTALYADVFGKIPPAEKAGVASPTTSVPKASSQNEPAITVPIRPNSPPIPDRLGGPNLG